MEKDLFDSWCRDATRLIRFTPDRKAVYKELKSHLEEHRDALIDQGMSPQKAQEEAVAAMGDAWELADQLAQIHTPFWGYAHLITKAIALSLCCSLLASILFFAGSTIHFYRNVNDGGQYLLQFPPDNSGWEAATLVHPNTTLYDNDYRLQLSDAVLWRKDAADRLSFFLQVYCLPSKESFSATRYFYAVDNQGNHYTYTDHRALKGPYITMHGGASAKGCRYIRLEIQLQSSSLEWVEFRYDRDGRELAFRIDLTGGETP